jgi:hypothetical protein
MAKRFIHVMLYQLEFHNFIEDLLPPSPIPPFEFHRAMRWQ